VENWWKRAKADLRTAKKNFRIKEYEAAALFCQQSVAEKVLRWIEKAL
jgi:HEPN domain-containing protein